MLMKVSTTTLPGSWRRQRLPLLMTATLLSSLSPDYALAQQVDPDEINVRFTPAGGNWKIRDEIRAMATFRHMNLMQPFTGLGKFDIIFCRNVAIYFTLQDRKKLFNKIADVLEPDGYLLIGSTESLTGICPRFVPKRHLRSVYYQLKG